MTHATSRSVHQQVGSEPDGRDHGNRADNDFYRTSPQAVLPLFQVEKFPGTVWEPACGDGAISEVLKVQPEIKQVISTDLIDRGYGSTGERWNFLTCPWIDYTCRYDESIGRMGYQHPVNHVVTNPPYRLAVDFALRVLKEDRLPVGGKLALFCRTLWLEGSTRHKQLFKPYPPSRVWTHRKRVPMARGGISMQTGLISFSWFVWEKGWTRPIDPASMLESMYLGGWL